MSVASSASHERVSLFERLTTPERGWLTLPAIFFLLAVFIFPLVLIGLYSVNLLTNRFGVPTEFSLVNWDSFLPPGDNVFWDRFKSSMVITLIVSVLAVVAAYPVAYFLAFVARRRRYTLLLLILAPFFTSYLLRVIACAGCIRPRPTADRRPRCGRRPSGRPRSRAFPAGPRAARECARPRA